jgi:site-specific DNA-methyltransferase (adenine-specific)
MNMTWRVDLMQGDCLEIMAEIEDGSVDLVLTDPPYGMSFQSNRRVARDKFAKIANDTSLDWLDAFFAECDRVMRADTAIYCFCSWHHVDVFKQTFERRFTLKNVLVWNKNNHGSGDLTGAYAPRHEFVLFGHKGRSLLREKRVPDVFDFPKIPSSKLVHPTEKNIDMLEVFVRNSSDAGDTVLDPFMGSGTTGVAAMQAGRRFIGIEMDAGYFDIAERRIMEARDANP